MNKLTLESLKTNDLYQFGEFRGTPVVIHDDDRWILPVLLAAQNNGRVPQPTLLINFDRHEDACELRKGLGPIPEIRKNACPQEQFLTMVDSHLCEIDDDWIKAGMELGLISDAVAFGIDARHRQDSTDTTYQDHLHESHRLFMWCDMPGGQLGFQGALSDLAARAVYEEYWGVLGWEHAGRGKRFWFREDAPKLILNLDLDCFALTWRDYCFPWPDEVYEREFHTESEYFSTQGLTGSDVFLGFAERAGVITIAREPNYTGGKEKNKLILRRVAQYLFNGELDLPELAAS